MLKNLKLRTKFFTAFGLVIVLFLASVLTSFYALNTTKKNFTEFHDEAFEVSNTTYQMRVYLQAVSKSVGNAILDTSVEGTLQYWEEVEKYASALQELTNYLPTVTDEPQLLALNDKLVQHMQASSSTRNQVGELAKQLRQEEAIAMYFNSYEPLLVQAQDIVVEADDFTNNYAEELYRTSESVIRTITILQVVVCMISLFVTVIITFKLTDLISTPIKQVQEAAENLAKGNVHLTNMLTYEAKDELGELCESMRYSMGALGDYIDEISDVLDVMARGDLTKDGDQITEFLGDFAGIKHSMVNILKKFNSTLNDINVSSQQVDAGAEQVAQGAQALSQGAAEQASSTEELAATVTEIAQKIGLAGEYAGQAESKTHEAGRVAEQCNDQMKELVGAMNDISHTSQEIGKIIKTIEDIAFQTNILALNAAVEAARAGAAGKGFAVVADEVRNLAAKSAEASKNTAALIEASMAAVDKGASLVNSTAEHLQIVANNSDEVATMVKRIAATAQEQTNAIKQVSVGIDQISAVVQTNSATSEESAAASEELSGQAQMLKELINRFTLYDNGNGAGMRKASYESSSYESTPVPQQSMSAAAYSSSSYGDKY